MYRAPRYRGHDFRLSISENLENARNEHREFVARMEQEDARKKQQEEQQEEPPLMSDDSNVGHCTQAEPYSSVPAEVEVARELLRATAVSVLDDRPVSIGGRPAVDMSNTDIATEMQHLREVAERVRWNPFLDRKFAFDRTLYVIDKLREEYRERAAANEKNVEAYFQARRARLVPSEPRRQREEADVTPTKPEAPFGSMQASLPVEQGFLDLSQPLRHDSRRTLSSSSDTDTEDGNEADDEKEVEKD